jgi:phosphate starvation-inducible PhoH-like protein
MSRGRKKKLTSEEQVEVLDMMLKEPETRTLNTIRVNLKCKTEKQKELVNLIKSKDITICSGYPGSGKTYLSCAVALELLKNNPNKYKKIVLVKSVTTLKDEEIGFLKGTMKEKMEPFMYSFIGNFEKIIGRHLLENLRANHLIEEQPLAYIRGITIDNAIIIVDETQNINKKNLRSIMTRLGEDSKMIFLGDEEQIDMKDATNSSLSYVMKHFSNLDEVGTVFFGEDDVVRHPLIKKMEQIFRQNP